MTEEKTSDLVLRRWLKELDKLDEQLISKNWDSELINKAMILEAKIKTRFSNKTYISIEKTIKNKLNKIYDREYYYHYC
jgi:hypothetical protein